MLIQLILLLTALYLGPIIFVFGAGWLVYKAIKTKNLKWYGWLAIHIAMYGLVFYFVVKDPYYLEGPNNTPEDISSFGQFWLPAVVVGSVEVCIAIIYTLYVRFAKFPYRN